MMADGKGLIFSNGTGSGNGEKKWLYSMSLFLLEAFLLFFCWNALTDWDEASFFFETQPRAVLALLVVSVTVFLWLFLQMMRRFLQTRSLRCLKWISAALLLAAFALQLVFLLHYRNLYLFDNAFVTGGASTLAAGEGPAAQARYYFSVYPNQNAYIVLTALLWKLGSSLGLSRGQIPFLLNTVNLICLDLTFWLIYQVFCLCRRESAPADRVWVILLLCMNPFLYIGVCYYYTIVLSMPFLMLMVYLSVRYLVPADARAVPLGAAGLMGVVFGAGYLLRATTVIPMIAILFTCVYFKRWKKQLWVMLITAALCIFLLGRWNADYIGIDTEDTAFPALHWVMMSMTPPGSHNEADEAYTASFTTKQQKQEGVRQRLAEKIDAISPADMLHLFVSKLQNTWGSGSSGYTVYLENCMETDGLYEWVFGQHKDGCLLFHQSYYLLLMLLFLRHLICSRKRQDVTAYVGQLTYLGGILFYLLWETSPQYSLPFLPFLMMGAAMGAQEREMGLLNRRRSLRFARSASGILGFAVLLVFYVCNFSAFTRAGGEWSHPVVTQILANDEVTVGAGMLFRQEFTADQPFNRIIFQYTSPDEGCEAVYEAALLDAQDHVLLQREISLEDAPPRNAAIYDFEEIVPQGREHYRLQIRMLDGSETDRIGIITYSMGHYDAYPGGSCLLGSKELETDMLLAVSRAYGGSYMSVRRYLFAGMLLFLPIFGILVYTIKVSCSTKKQVQAQRATRPDRQAKESADKNMQTVSIITMSYNDLSHLRECVAGILKQDYEKIEYIIVDGGSTDGSRDFIAATAERLGERCKWVSEPDRGLYDALNKGIKMASGDIIGIMNDCFANEHVISAMVEAIEREGTDGVHGNINYVSGGRVVRRWRMGQGSIRTGWQAGHPTLYLKRSVYETYGLYRIDLPIAADYEFIIRILKDGKVRLSYIDEVLVNMFHGENSTSTGSAGSYVRSLRDGHRALRENGIRHAWFTDICRMVRFALQFVRR